MNKADAYSFFDLLNIYLFIYLNLKLLICVGLLQDLILKSSGFWKGVLSSVPTHGFSSNFA